MDTRKPSGRFARIGEFYAWEWYSVDDNTVYDSEGKPVDGYGTHVSMINRHFAGNDFEVTFYDTSLDDFRKMKIQRKKN